MPEKESDHLTPATRLLEKRREMAEVETALSQQKEVLSSLANSEKSLYNIPYHYSRNSR